eukprot:s9438_g1.t1
MGGSHCEDESDVWSLEAVQKYVTAHIFGRGRGVRVPRSPFVITALFSICGLLPESMGDSQSKQWLYDQDEFTRNGYGRPTTGDLVVGCSPWSDDSIDDTTPMWRPCSDTDTAGIGQWGWLASCFGPGRWNAGPGWNLREARENPSAGAPLSQKGAQDSRRDACASEVRKPSDDFPLEAAEKSVHAGGMARDELSQLRMERFWASPTKDVDEAECQGCRSREALGLGLGLLNGMQH